MHLGDRLDERCLSKDSSVLRDACLERFSPGVCVRGDVLLSDAILMCWTILGEEVWDAAWT